MPAEPTEKFRKGALLTIVAVISVVFIAMVRPFLMAIFLAAILSGMVHPVYRRVVRWVKGRQRLASALTTLGVFFVIVVPLLGLAGLVVSQALEISDAVTPWVQEQLERRNELDAFLARLPFYEFIEPYRAQIFQKVGEFVAGIGTFLVGQLAATTRGTAVFFFMLFITLYSMFFFLVDGRALLNKVLYYIPLGPKEENRMLGKFMSVSRATIKGTLVIGIVQGTLAGLAFWVLGVNGALFWGTIMAVLSIIPGIGAALVWVPAVGYLMAIGRPVAAIVLLVWCAGLVGTVDNLLRPWLVGRDTKMPDLLILLGTLGGILLFGAAGVVLGPIVAALFVTVWDIYGTTFSDVLPAVE